MIAEIGFTYSDAINGVELLLVNTRSVGRWHGSSYIVLRSGFEMLHHRDKIDNIHYTLNCPLSPN